MLKCSLFVVGSCRMKAHRMRAAEYLTGWPNVSHYGIFQVLSNLIRLMERNEALKQF
jgi:hypothetical protein